MKLFPIKWKFAVKVAHKFRRICERLFEKRLHYCTTIAHQKSCEKPANRRAASDEISPLYTAAVGLPVVKKNPENGTAL